jgi:hypothetical protein
MTDMNDMKKNMWLRILKTVNHQKGLKGIIIIIMIIHTMQMYITVNLHILFVL